jgi:hypothetical protein
MERQDDRPRAYPEGEAGRYDDGSPEEGSAAADADREYSDTEAERADARSRPATTTTGPDTDMPDAPAQSPAGDAAEAQAATATGPEFAGTADTERADSAAAERKAVGPSRDDAGMPRETGAEARAGEATAAGSGDQWAAREETGVRREGEAQTSPGGVAVAEEPTGFSDEESRTFQERWDSIQGTFIDDPHAATEKADALVGEVMERLTQLRNDYLRDLREAIGDGSDTEAMRVALTRYRAFFQMLVR